MVADQLDSILFILFGIPGAGKTTIAKNVVQKLLTSTSNVIETGNDAKVQPKPFILDLDLDDCVPEWMRLNFAKGIYPTLQQRNQFSSSCCEYVNQSLRKFSQSNFATTISPSNSVDKQILVIVSFSFVNDDLRINFRQQFPNSHWILIDTSEIEAQRRIRQRSDHFYKGKPCQTLESDVPVHNQSSRDNNEWKFAPVAFPHTIVNGHNAIEETTSEIVELIQNTIQVSSSINDD